MKPDGFWRIPRIWRDRTAYILGGGPSLRSVEVTRLKGQRVIACNNAYRLAPWIDVMVCMDAQWPEHPIHQRELPMFAGLKISGHKDHRAQKHDGLDLRVVRGRTESGISTDPNAVHTNLNSGAFAISVAVQLGARRIILLGFDMQTVEKTHNWHADHKVRAGQDRNPYPKFLARFPAISEDLKRLGVECINATPGSALTVFPIVDPESVIPLRLKTGYLVRRDAMEAATC